MFWSNVVCICIYITPLKPRSLLARASWLWVQRKYLFAFYFLVWIGLLLVLFVWFAIFSPSLYSAIIYRIVFCCCCCCFGSCNVCHEEKKKLKRYPSYLIDFKDSTGLDVNCLVKLRLRIYIDPVTTDKGCILLFHSRTGGHGYVYCHAGQD